MSVCWAGQFRQWGGPFVSAEENKAVSRRVLQEVIGKGNLDVIDQLIAADYAYFAPGSPEVRGPEGYRQLVTMYRSAFPDLTMTEDDILAEGDKVVMRWTGSGTHRGELMGIPPTGKRVNVSGILISRFAGGKIVEEHEIFDALGMLQQLGVVPAQEQAQA
jgi:steroid delta-isomerase-like uncharacterized protein